MSNINHIDIFNVDGKLFVEFKKTPNLDVISLKMIGVRKLGVLSNNELIAKFDITPESIRCLMVNNGLWTAFPSINGDKIIINKYDIAV